MTTAARETEARAADIAFQVALAQVGAGTIEEALAAWSALDPTDVQATTDRWLTRAVNLILGRRRMSRDLAMGYYRLVRALRTGSTIADPFRPDPEYVTLGQLRRQFRLLVEELDWMHGGPAPTGADEPDEEVDTQRVLTEVMDGLREEELANEAAAEQAAIKDLQFLGPKALDAKTAKISPDDTVGDTDALVASEYRKAGARVAKSSERLAMNGGRGSVYTYGEKDIRAIAWVRVSLSGDPCSFCAMLISRGINYKSARTAGFDSDGDLYHDNCHCVAVPIFSEAQFLTDPRFDQNRVLRDLWDEEVKGKYSGNEARNAWRRLIEEGRRSGKAHWIEKSWVTTPTRSTTDSPALVAG